MKQKVVIANELSSRLMRGDPDADRSRAGPLSGKALPTLLEEGWRITSQTTPGDGNVHYVLERDD